MRKIFTIALTFLSTTILFAQEKEEKPLPCGQPMHEQRVKNAVGFNAVHQLMEDAYEAEIQQIIANQQPEQRGGQTIYVIPVVFHIVHEGGSENISDAQVHDAVAILNRDFNKQNADTNMVVSAFANNIADVGVEFRLAQYDELGNCVSGITRTFSSKTNDGDNAMVDDVNRNLNNSATNTSNVRYPRNHYLNIWVCKNASGAAGYTQNPNNFTPAKYDGIWVTNSYVGSIGTSSAVRSRTLTHEVGHWLNLDHVWGGTNTPGVTCGDDNVADTPETEGWDNCNLAGASCGNTLDNVQNYMEYSYCSRMFTNGQKSRMRASLNSGTGQRNQLWTAQNLLDAGVDGTDNLCAASFTTDRFVICAGESVGFTDNSYHGPTTWNWTFTGGSPLNSTDQNPTTITYNTVGQYPVSLTVGNGATSQSTTQNNYIIVVPNTGLAAPFQEGFEAISAIPNNEWFVNNLDNGQTWAIATGVGSTGTKCIKNSNGLSSTGSIDEIISTTYDLSGMSSVILSFKYAFAYKNSNNTDKLKVMVSNDCGASWSVRRTISGPSLNTAPNTTAAFNPTSSQWAQVDVTNILSSYFVPNFMFKITFEGGGGNHIYVDDINISGVVSVDENPDPNRVTVYPNPSSDLTTVSFYLFNDEMVNVELLDMVGKVVRSQSMGNLSSGEHRVDVPRMDLSSGVYFVRLSIGESSVVRKLVIE